MLASLMGLLTLQNTTEATHVMGGDLEVECIDEQDSVFELSMSIYRDCRGIDLSTDQSLTINAEGAGCPSKIVDFDHDATRDVTPLSCGATSACDGGSGSVPFGMEVYEFSATVDLSDLMAQGCCNLTIEGIDDCCRNDIISNISSPGSSRYWMSHEFNPCEDEEGCPNTPEFATAPIAIACEGEPFIFNQGADAGPDDSIGFELVDPLEDNGQPVNWVGGYSAEEPVDYLGKGQFPITAPMPYGFHFDENTGDVQFTPDEAGKSYLISVQVNQYRDGEQISQMRRDLQVEFIDCADNEPPQADFEPYHEVCAGEAVSIDIDVADPDSQPPNPDSVWVDWNEGIPDGDFTPDSGEVYATGSFTWTPEQHHAGPNPHTFVYDARDNACPVPGTNNQTISIKVDPKPEAIIDYEVKECGEVKFSANLTNYPVANYNWSGKGGVSSNQEEFTHYYEEPGEYPFSVTLTSNECVNTYHDTVEVPEFLTVDAGEDRFICKDEEVNVDTEVEYEEGEVTYAWNTLDSTSSISHSFTEDTSLVVTASDESDCLARDTIDVTVFDYPDPGFTTERVCHGADFEIGTGYSGSLYDHEWSKVGQEQVLSTDSLLEINSVTEADSGLYAVSITDTTEAQCTGHDTLDLRVNPEVDAQADPSEICVGDTSDLSASGGDNFVWTDITGQDTLSMDASVKVSPEQTTEYVIRAYSTTKGVYCEDLDTIEVEVNPLPEVEAATLPGFGGQDPVCEDYGIYMLSDGDPIGGSWEGPGVEDGNQFNTNDAGTGIHTLTYGFTDVNGCYNEDDTDIEVQPLPEIDLDEDALDEYFPVCSADDPIDLTDLHGPEMEGTPEWSGEGVVGGTELDHQDADLNPGISYELTLTVEDQYGCTNVESFTYEYIETPHVETMDHEVCIDGGMVDLDDLANQRGTRADWQGPGVDNEANTFDPSEAGVNEAGHELELTYTEINEECSNSDVSEIVVHPLPDINSISVEEELVCETDGNYRFNADPAGGTWEGPGVIEDEDEFSPAEAGVGEHTYTYHYEDPATGCTNSDELQAEVEGQPEISLVEDTDVLCAGDTYNLETEYNEYVDPEGITWEAVEGNGLLVPSAASARYTATRDDALAEGFTVRVETEAGEVCAADEDISDFGVHPTPEAGYSIEDPEGCEPHETGFIDESTLPEGTEVEITEWQWDLGNGKHSDEQHPVEVYEEAGTYDISLRVETSEGCYDEANTGQVEVYPRPEADFTAEPVVTTILTPTVEFENETSPVTEDMSYEWNFGDHAVMDGGVSRQENPVYSYQDTGRFDVTLHAENKYGCDHEVVKEQHITIEPEVQVYIPNAFSPNGAGGPEVNQFFRPVTHGITDYHLRVYDRWGQRVFESDDPEESWDGTIDGQPAEEATYTYILEVVGLSGEDYQFSGTVHLIR